MNWWEEDLTYYKPSSTYPDWAGCSPTSDMDIEWFVLHPSQVWQAFAFEYFNERMCVRFKKTDQGIAISTYIPALKKEDLADINPEDLNEYFRCSVWLGDESCKTDSQTRPIKSVKYHLLDGLDLPVEIDYTPEKVYFGFYTCDWY